MSRHSGLQLPARTPDARVQQRLANLESQAKMFSAGVQSDWGGRMRLIAGTISSTTPTIVSGAGFSLNKTATGTVTVTFDTAYSAAPAVIIVPAYSGSPATLRYAFPQTVAAGSFVAISQQAAALTDLTYFFMAFGPA